MAAETNPTLARAIEHARGLGVGWEFIWCFAVRHGKLPENIPELNAYLDEVGRGTLPTCDVVAREHGAWYLPSSRAGTGSGSTPVPDPAAPGYVPPAAPAAPSGGEVGIPGRMPAAPGAVAPTPDLFEGIKRFWNENDTNKAIVVGAGVVVVLVAKGS